MLLDDSGYLLGRYPSPSPLVIVNESALVAPLAPFDAVEKLARELLGSCPVHIAIARTTTHVCSRGLQG